MFELPVCFKRYGRALKSDNDTQSMKFLMEFVFRELKYFFKMGHPLSLFCFIFNFSQSLVVSKSIFLLMVGFELRISGVRGVPSSNCAATNDRQLKLIVN